MPVFMVYPPLEYVTNLRNEDNIKPGRYFLIKYATGWMHIKDNGPEIKVNKEKMKKQIIIIIIQII